MYYWSNLRADVGLCSFRDRYLNKLFHTIIKYPVFILFALNFESCIADDIAQSERHAFSLNIIFTIAIIIAVIVIFLIREQRIKKQYKKLERELRVRIKKIGEQEDKIVQQKQELYSQINLSDKQDEVIHNQTIELEKSRRHLEKTVELRTRELKDAKNKAEESDRLKTAFLENMSHEIRTPMNAIMGFASLLSLTDISVQEKGKYIIRINNNCRLLLKLIDDILDMSKIQANQMVIVKKKFSVDELLQEIHDEIVTEHKELEIKNIKLEFIRNKKNKDYIVYSDPVRFRQIFLNLLRNATKYTEKGYIRFGYEPLFDSDYNNEPSMLKFYVEDTGIGIPPEKSNFIFEWFNKIEDDPSKLYRGAGLGLYISKELLRLMGGEIWFNSKLKEGSTFFFNLPYFDTTEVKSNKDRKQTSEQSIKKENYDWQKKTILIVEDEDNNVLYLKEIIKRTGAPTLEARDGKQAVKLVEENPSISLVLMDLMMPEMDGYVTTRKIKSIRPNLPVIAQTAYTNAREKEKSLEVGCDGYISKPYNHPELLDLINNFL